MLVFRILTLLLPMAQAFARALRKDSPGGKKITPEEVATILLAEGPALAEKLEGLDPKRG